MHTAVFLLSEEAFWPVKHAPTLCRGFFWSFFEDQARVVMSIESASYMETWMCSNVMV